MNLLEREMVNLLKKGISSGSLVGVKAEFESEGTRTDELLRLVDIARSANALIALKIGGCEAVRDLYEAKRIGVNHLVAPMVESSYALQKYSQAISRCYSGYELESTKFMFNVETKQTFDQIQDIITVARESNNVTGVVFGRNDYATSINLVDPNVESQEVTNDVLRTAELTKVSNLEMVVGGGVSIASIPNLSKIREVHLSRFETRKILFNSHALSGATIENDLLDAVKFELLWLRNKQEYYFGISREDETRFKTLKSRWNLT